MNKKFTARILSMLMVMLMLVSMLPTSVFAAPASDIPANMLDNVYLDALEYTGYKVQAQKNDGTIFKKYSGGATAYLSKISYGLNKYGTETVTKSGTATGLAPDIAGFESSGLCCASYVSYVYYNYLPNIAGIDTSSAAILAGFCNSAKSSFSRLCNIASLFSTGLWIDDKNNGQPRYCISNSSQYTAAKVPSSAGS